MPLSILRQLSAQRPQSLLQSVLLLGGGLVCLGADGLGLAGLGLVELGAQGDAGVVGQLAQQLVHGVLADRGARGLGDGVLVDAVAHGVLLVLLLELLEGGEGALGVHGALGNVHRLARLAHHVRHAVHGVVGLDLRRRELGHVGHLVHLGGEGLLGQQDLGLLVGLGGVTLLEQVLDLFSEEGVLLCGLLGLFARLLGLELRKGKVSGGGFK